MVRIQAQVDGFNCEVLHRTSDRYSRALVERSVIGYDGVKIEDMGLDSGVYNFETIWQRENYPLHELFLNRYKRMTAGNSIAHPVYGILNGKIRNINIDHIANEIDCVHISFEFVQNPERQIAGGLPRLSSIIPLAESVAADISAVARFVGSAASALGAIQATVAQKEARINMIDGIANNLVRSMVFPVSIPGKIAQMAFRIAASAERDTLTVLESPKNGIVAVLEHTRLTAQLLARTHTVLGVAVRSAGAYISAYLAVNSFVASTASTGSDTTATEAMSKRDIEETVNIIRRDIAEIASADKTGTIALQNVALVLAEEARKTLAVMGGEKEVEVKREVSIYAVLLDNRISRHRANEVCLRNNIENPNRVKGMLFLPESDY